MNILLRKIERIKSPSLKTQWGNYHSHEFDSTNISPRFARLLSVLNELPDIKSAIDIAANQGYFSNLVLNNTSIKKVVSTDYDENAVDIMYSQFKNADLRPDAIVLQDFTNPVSNLKTVPFEKRMKFENVISLERK